MKTLDLVYGLPGEGKSTLALELVDQRQDLVVENDHFFTSLQGVYKYDEELSEVAGWWCWAETFRRLQFEDHIAVANTFYDPTVVIGYIRKAKALRIKVRLFRANRNQLPEVSFQRCVRGLTLPKFKYIQEQMENTWGEKFETSVLGRVITIDGITHENLHGWRDLAKTYKL